MRMRTSTSVLEGGISMLNFRLECPSAEAQHVPQVFLEKLQMRGFQFTFRYGYSFNSSENSIFSSFTWLGFSFPPNLMVLAWLLSGSILLITTHSSLSKLVKAIRILPLRQLLTSLLKISSVEVRVDRSISSGTQPVSRQVQLHSQMECRWASFKGSPARKSACEQPRGHLIARLVPFRNTRNPQPPGNSFMANSFMLFRSWCWQMDMRQAQQPSTGLYLTIFSTSWPSRSTLLRPSSRQTSSLVPLMALVLMQNSYFSSWRRVAMEALFSRLELFCSNSDFQNYDGSSRLSVLFIDFQTLPCELFLALVVFWSCPWLEQPSSLPYLPSMKLVVMTPPSCSNTQIRPSSSFLSTSMEFVSEAAYFYGTPILTICLLACWQFSFNCKGVRSWSISLYCL